MNKTNYNILNEETENNFTTRRNNDIMNIYNKITEISEKAKQNSFGTNTTMPDFSKITGSGKNKNEHITDIKKPSEIKPIPLPYKPSKEKENKPRPLPYRPSEQGEPKLILFDVPKEKKERERLKRATGGYDLKKIDPEKIREHLRLKEKTPDDYYSLSVPRKELDERLNKEAFGPKTDFSVWNFENNYDKLNKEEQSMLIHKMQLAFNNEGYKDNNGRSLKPDGIFGNKTKSVYKQYKKDKKDELEDYEPDDKKIVEGEDYNVLKDSNGKPVILASTNMNGLTKMSQDIYADNIREPEDKQLDFDDQKKIDALVYVYNLTDNTEEKEAYRRAIVQIRQQEKYKNIYKNSVNGIYKDDYNYTSQANLTAMVNIMSEGMAWLEGGENFWNDFSLDVIRELTKSKSLNFFDNLSTLIKFMDSDYYSKAENLKQGDIIVTLNGAYSDSSLGTANKKNFLRDKRGSLYRILSSE